MALVWSPCRSDAGAAGNDDNSDSSISGDGRFVAFWSAATNLVERDRNGNNLAPGGASGQEIFVHVLSWRAGG